MPLVGGVEGGRHGATSQPQDPYLSPEKAEQLDELLNCAGLGRVQPWPRTARELQLTFGVRVCRRFRSL